jgi:hypothetical protein
MSFDDWKVKRNRKLAEAKAKLDRGEIDYMQWRNMRDRIVAAHPEPARKAKPVDPELREREVEIAYEEAGHLLVMAEYDVRGEVILSAETNEGVVFPASGADLQRQRALDPEAQATVSVAGHVARCILHDEEPRLGAIIFGSDGREFLEAVDLMLEGDDDLDAEAREAYVEAAFGEACERARKILSRGDVLKRTVGEIRRGEHAASDWVLDRFARELEAKRFGQPKPEPVFEPPVDPREELEDRAVQAVALAVADPALDVQEIYAAVADLAHALNTRIEALERLPSNALEWVRGNLGPNRVLLLPSAFYAGRQEYARALHETGDTDAALLAETKFLEGLHDGAAALTVQQHGRSLFRGRYITVAVDPASELPSASYVTRIYEDGKGPGYEPSDPERDNDPDLPYYDDFEEQLPAPPTHEEAKAVGRRELPRIFGRKKS